MKRVLLTLTVLALASAIAGAQTGTTAVPSLVNYQGKLTDANGNPVATANYNLTFRIWNDFASTDTSASNLLWVERHTSAPVVRGHFNVILGSGDALEGFEDRRNLATAFFTSATRYLSIEVGTTDLSTEIKPRTQLLSAPYAFQAERALHGVPVGTIAPYFGAQNAPPEGWLYCDGSEIPDEPKYAALRAHLLSQPSVPTEIYNPGTEEFWTPNLAGRFVYGISTPAQLGVTGGVDIHQHSVDIAVFASANATGNYGHAGVTDNDGVVRTHAHWVDPPATLSTSANHLPPYLRVSFIIKI